MEGVDDVSEWGSYELQQCHLANNGLTVMATVEGFALGVILVVWVFNWADKDGWEKSGRRLTIVTVTTIILMIAFSACGYYGRASLWPLPLIPAGILTAQLIYAASRAYP
jgi:hypothetical protein